ncbi:MAG: hypothetical protein ABW034_17405 [Steroidobacteraceae bacterium]
MGLLLTASANADDHSGWKHRRDSHHRYDDRGRHGGHDYDRREWSRRDYPRREYRSYRNNGRWDDRSHRNNGRWDDRSYRNNGRWDDRYRGRARPYWNYRSDNHRHYGYSPFYAPVRYYRSEAYSPYPYRAIDRGHDAEATVILSFPL